MSDAWLLPVVIAAGIAAGGVASVAGFGIGSLLTPLLVTQVTTKVAVAAVAIPHVAGTAARFWLLRSQVDRRCSSRSVRPAPRWTDWRTPAELDEQPSA